MSNSMFAMGQAAAAGTPLAGSWELSYAYYDPPEDLAWDISTASYIQTFSIAAQDGDPASLFFKPDGTKMYFVGYSGDAVYEYSLSTAWNISTASYVRSFSVAGQETNPYGLFFKPDGTKMYVMGTTGDDVNEYDLSTAWNISTASYTQNFSVSAQETNPRGLFFKPDGTKMYVLGNSGSGVNEYDLSTAWDVSTASYLQNFSVSAQETNPAQLFFKPDGTAMYLVGSVGDDVNQYSLSTAWDVSTASYVQSFSVAAQEATPQGLFFKPDGTKMYVMGITGDDVNEYILGGFSVSAQESTPTGLAFSSDGNKMYALGQNGDDVNEYSLSVAWDTSTASYTQVFSIASQETSPTSLFFKPDGTKMYVLGSAGDDINEYSLSTAWDVSTASYVRVSSSLAGQDTVPNSIFFKPDGTKVYMTGQSSDKVHEYNLSTAWDVSTISFLQTSTVSSINPTGLFFKDDGTKMYLSSSSYIQEYALSTAWDISTATYVVLFSYPVSQQREVFFRPDGTQMFAINISEQKVFTYTLGVQP